MLVHFVDNVWNIPQPKFLIGVTGSSQELQGSHSETHTRTYRFRRFGDDFEWGYAICTISGLSLEGQELRVEIHWQHLLTANWHTRLVPKNQCKLFCLCREVMPLIRREYLSLIGFLPWRVIWNRKGLFDSDNTVNYGFMACIRLKSLRDSNSGLRSPARDQRPTWTVIANHQQGRSSTLLENM